MIPEMQTPKSALQTTAETISPSVSTRLNFIRVIAAWFVVVGHGFSFNQITIFRSQEWFPYIQSIGVVLLLLLSGYLMAFRVNKDFSKEERGKLQNSHIYIYICDKIGRIYSALIPALIVGLLLDFVQMRYLHSAYPFYAYFTVRNFLGTLFQIQMIPSLSRNLLCFGSMEQLWTLSVEWWLYMASGYIAYVVVVRCQNHQLRLSDVVKAVLICYPVLDYTLRGIIPVAPIIWGIGFSIFYLQKHLIVLGSAYKLRVALCGAMILTIGVGLWKKDAYSMAFVLSISLVMLLSLWCAQQNIKKEIRFEKSLRFFASYTYSLYLVHYPVMEFYFWGYPMLSRWDRFFITIIISNMLSIAFSRIFESKGKNLARWLEIQLHVGKENSKN